MDLRTNSDYGALQNYLQCLLRGTNWDFK